jgi:ubiquinone/menaquinone biosynthesis C-methylase UbiE
MSAGRVALPYFDRILELLERGDPEVSLAFGRHVHWGFWDDPARSDGSLTDYAAATRRLARRVCAAAGVSDGDGVLDVGCGFGGTLEELNERFDGLGLIGANIDIRQLIRALNLVHARGKNRVRLVAADACRLPFRDAAFDVVLAVEAIFHFPSRPSFLAEARRVLRPNGRLALCDFVPRFVVPFLWDRFDRRFKPVVNRLYGQSDMRCTLGDYRRLAHEAGLRLTKTDDITRKTWPTFRVLRPLIRRIAPEPDEAAQVVARVEFTTRIGLLRYLVLTFAAK